MALVILEEAGLHRPMIVCDFCHRPVATATDGNYQWVMGGPPPQAIYFTHKHCCRAFETAHPLPAGELWGAIDLTCLPIYLGTNLALDWKDAKAKAILLGSLEW